MIAVRLDARGPNSRWYAGAGLIRPVRLILMPAALHVPIWAVGVQTIALDQYDATATADDRSDRDAAAKVMATVRVNVTLANKSDRNSTGQLTVMVSAADRASGTADAVAATAEITCCGRASRRTTFLQH